MSKTLLWGCGRNMATGLAAELLAKHKNSTQASSQVLCAVLAATLEVLESQGLPATPAALFAAVMSSLEKPEGSGPHEVSILDYTQTTFLHFILWLHSCTLSSLQQMIAYQLHLSWGFNADHAASFQFAAPYAFQLAWLKNDNMHDLSLLTLYCLLLIVYHLLSGLFVFCHCLGSAR